MSVWKSTSYKLDIARALYEALPGRIDKILGERVDRYLSPARGLCPITVEDSWEDVAVICRWEDVPDRDAIEEDFDDSYSSVSAWYIGGSALYQVINAVSRGKFQVSEQYDYSAIYTVADEVFKLVTPSTQVAPKRAMLAFRASRPDLVAIGENYESASEAFKFFRFAFDDTSGEFVEIDQSRYFGEGSRCYYGHVTRGVCIMRGAQEYSERGLIFLRPHLDFLVEALSRIANIYYFMATEYAEEPEAVTAVLAMLGETVECSFRARGKNADKVVQAFHKARMYAQMLIFENCHHGALVEARREFVTRGWSEVISLDRFLDIVKGAPENRRLDVLQVYKWMIPPDFDSTYAFDDLYNWHMNPRPSGADPEASSEMKALWKLVVEERKRNIVAAYHAKCREWPTSESGVPCQPNNIDKWDLRKIFPYVAYGKDVVTQIKDKTTVAASIEVERDPFVPSREKSFLLWYIENVDHINTEQDALSLSSKSLKEDNYSRVAYKGEAHKPGSRLFFMAPPRRRILLGELEGNISDVATYYPGSLQGKDSHQKTEMLQKLFDIYEDPPGVSPDVITETYIVTFDLSKFSPKSNANVTRDYHEFWATVFGYPAIEAMYEIGPESTILHMQSGLIMEYQNAGADLEGFRGRMMTLFHADMLGAACRLARSKGHIAGKAVLAVFIDDGAVKIAAVGEGDQSLRNANAFLEIMQKVYASAGQENHPNKTILSKIGGELLAEQFLYRNRLKCPIKAAMRLYPDYENPACCITEEFDALFAASQGCVKDQGKWFPTYRRYVVAFVKSLYRWNHRRLEYGHPLHIALKIIAPKSFGGFGLQPLQGITSTGTLNMTAEGLGMLNTAARAYPEIASRITKVIDVPIVVREPESILRDPSRVVAHRAILVENRLMMAIIKHLEKPGSVAARFMRGYKAEELRAHARAVAIALLSEDSINATLLAKAWACTPLAYVESIVGKFRRARTIITMLGWTSISAIRRKNMHEVGKVLSDNF